ncbi:Sfi1 spindle body protein-domain-containing protein [Lipomyces arxii]|uniref:Sfi1 spindle body protein-domain-containing protein n=1 Tax=Lipomyces arxii TaxID=56418 RepID=UPI0034CD1F87
MATGNESTNRPDPYRNLSSVVDPLSPDDQQALQPVLHRQSDADVRYSISDINILRSIVQLATRSEQNLEGNNFITIFKSYETVLRRKRIDTSKDTFYFKLVVKLCRSIGDSWVLKFNNLLREINASLISRRKPEFKYCYRQFLYLIIQRRFRQWRHRTINRQAEAVALYRAAVKYDQSTLASQAFEIWRTRLNQFAHREESLRQFAAENHLRDAILIWRAKTQQVQNLQARAAELHSLTRLRYLKTWFHKACLVQAQQYYDSSLTQKYIDTWVIALEKIDDLNERADLFRRSILLRQAFSAWESHTVGVLEQYDLAQVFARRRLLRSSWMAWTQAKTLTKAEHELEALSDMSSALRFLTLWRTRTFMNIRAQLHYDEVLLVRYIKILRNQVRLPLVVDLFERRTKQHALHAWALKERGKLSRRVNNRRLVTRSFTIWKAKTAKRLERDSGIVDRLYGVKNYRVAAGVLKGWRRKLAHVQKMELVAEDHDGAALMSRAMHTLKLKSAQYHTMCTRAESHARVKLLSTNFSMWQLKLEEKRDKYRKGLLQRFTIEKNRRLIQSIFNLWVENTTEKLDLMLLADDVFEQSSTALMRSVFFTWRHSVDHIVQMEDAADNFSQEQLLTRSLNTWHAKKQQNNKAEDRASAVYDINSLLRAQNIIRRWNMRALQVGILNSRAQVFRDKQQYNKTRDILGAWVDLTRELVLERNREQGGEAASDFEDGSDSRTITGLSLDTIDVNDEQLAYTPTRRRTTAKVGFAALPKLDLATPRVERWARLRNSPKYEGRRKLFATPVMRRDWVDGERTV